ncbi:MAG: DUF362 domain-containing protein [Tissierellia bacterium]|nr:DUF362 domain-containing protein [Tissierellia bacterium]
MDRVYIYKTVNYDENLIYRNLKKIVDESNLLEILKPESKIFLKLNLLIGKAPEYAVTTHPEIVKQMAKILYENGHKVIVGDSPAGPLTQPALRSIYKQSGLIDAEKGGYFTLNYNCESLNYKADNAKKLKAFDIMKVLTEVDYIINICKLKTHSMMTFTCAVKNMYGAIVGLEKAKNHFKMHNAENFANHIIDVCEAVNPIFTIVDGVIGMEGNGPSGGDPIESKILAAGFNPYAIDKVLIDKIGFLEKDVLTVKFSRERKLFQEIEIINDFDLAEIPKFKMPRSQDMSFLPNFIGGRLRSIIVNSLKSKPKFLHERCIKCKRCGEICPAQIISFNESNLPIFDKKKCISCFCCHEVCPVKAIGVKRGLGSIFWGR